MKTTKHYKYIFNFSTLRATLRQKRNVRGATRILKEKCTDYALAQKNYVLFSFYTVYPLYLKMVVTSIPQGKVFVGQLYTLHLMTAVPPAVAQSIGSA